MLVLANPDAFKAFRVMDCPFARAPAFLAQCRQRGHKLADRVKGFVFALVKGYPSSVAAPGVVISEDGDIYGGVTALVVSIV